MTKNAYKKYMAKKEKESKKAAKSEKAAAAAAPEEPLNLAPVAYTKDEPKEIFGDLELVQSNQATGREFVHVSHLNAASYEGKEVWVRCRIHNSRSKGNNCFLVLRQSGFTVQGAMFKSETISKEMIKFSGSISKESIVDVKVNTMSPLQSSTLVCCYCHRLRLFFPS
jgi:hypothetical protein